MNARLKLNSAFFQGAVLMAALVGWVTGSWIVFIVAAGLILFTAHQSGDIRTKPSYRSPYKSSSRPQSKSRGRR